MSLIAPDAAGFSQSDFGETSIEKWALGLDAAGFSQSDFGETSIEKFVLGLDGVGFSQSEAGATWWLDPILLIRSYIGEFTGLKKLVRKSFGRLAKKVTIKGAFK